MIRYFSGNQLASHFVVSRKIFVHCFDVFSASWGVVMIFVLELIDSVDFFLPNISTYDRSTIYFSNFFLSFNYSQVNTHMNFEKNGFTLSTVRKITRTVMSEILSLNCGESEITVFAKKLIGFDTTMWCKHHIHWGTSLSYDNQIKTMNMLFMVCELIAFIVYSFFYVWNVHSMQLLLSLF